MLLNQTDVVVDEDLEKVIIYVTIDNSTEIDVWDYEYSSGETTETSIETKACLQLG